MASDKKGARSYKGQIIGDSMSVTINFKWLLQLCAGICMLVYAWWQLESRIQDLERSMVLAMQERKAAEAKHVKEMEEEVSLLKKELNINPFSWSKKKK